MASAKIGAHEPFETARATTGEISSLSPAAVGADTLGSIHF
jgi:hypothetical protein